MVDLVRYSYENNDIKSNAIVYSRFDTTNRERRKYIKYKTSTMKKCLLISVLSFYEKYS